MHTASCKHGEYMLHVGNHREAGFRDNQECYGSNPSKQPGTSSPPKLIPTCFHLPTNSFPPTSCPMPHSETTAHAPCHSSLPLSPPGSYKHPHWKENLCGTAASGTLLQYPGFEPRLCTALGSAGPLDCPWSNRCSPKLAPPHCPSFNTLVSPSPVNTRSLPALSLHSSHKTSTFPAKPRSFHPTIQKETLRRQIQDNLLYTDTDNISPPPSPQNRKKATYPSLLEPQEGIPSSDTASLQTKHQ